MPGKTLALIVGLLVLTVILLYASLQINHPGQPVANNKEQTSQPTKTAIESPTPTPPAYTILSLSPNPVILSASNTGTVNVMIDTDKNEVQAVQLEIAYDPKAISNIVIASGDFFANPTILTKKIETTNGRITYALGITPAQKAVKGKGTVAVITFSKNPGTTLTQSPLTLMPKSLVTQSGVSDSVLKTQTGTTIMLSTNKQPAQQ